jgi:hypothetical protein
MTAWGIVYNGLGETYMLPVISIREQTLPGSLRVSACE